MSLTIRATSKEYLKVEITAIKNGAAYDPTGDTVEFYFAADDDADLAGVVWSAGSWETMDGHYLARCLLGPGGAKQLTAGNYYVFVRVTDNPETPIKCAGPITIK